MARLLSIQPELKPLVVQLRRLKVGAYLYSEFDNIACENDWDAAWDACKRQIYRTVTVFGMGHDNTIEEDAIALMLNMARQQSLDVFEVMLTTVVKGFVDWSKEAVNLEPLCESLLPLGLTSGCRAVLKDVATRAKEKPIAPTGSEVKSKREPQEATMMGNKVFVVHGHDEARRRELCSMLKDDLGLDPIVVQEQPNESIETILGKIERLASQCHVAIVLMTADDEMKSGAKRARQNVVLELGYFLGLWRTAEQRRIIIIRAPGVDEPSDINGVVYLPYTNVVKEVYLDLNKQLKHWEIAVS